MQLNVARAEAQIGFKTISGQRGLVANAIVRARHWYIEARIMLKGLERHVFFIAGTAGLPARDPVDREDAAMLRVEPGRQQQVLVLSAIEPNRDGVVLEQVDHWRAVQPDVVQCGADALCS